MTIDPDTEQALQFLEWLRPGGPWVLTAIPPEKGGTTTETFHGLAAARGWIQRFNGKQNLYYAPNRLRGDVDRKAKKEDVEWMDFAFCDVDPRRGEDLAAEQARIVDVLAALSPAPSAVVFSGGGYQALWRLDEPLFIGGDWNRIRDGEAVNRGLEVALGGDHCWNIDRILRLPGTINIPDAKKYKLGRVEALATIEDFNDTVHALHDFKMAYEEEKRAAAAARRVELGDVRLIGLDELPETVSAETRAIIVTCDHPTDPGRYGSKSEAQWRVTCDLVKASCTDEQIAGVLLNPALGVSDHPLRQKRSKEYVARQIARAREHAFDVTPDGRRVFSFASPYKTAQRLQIEVFPSTIHINGDWLVYRDGAYALVEDRTMKAKLYGILSDAAVTERKGEEVIFHPFNPDPTKVGKVVEALQAVTHQEADAKAPPCWLDGDGPPALEIISCRNGLLHLPTGELLQPTPNFFTRNALEIEYDPGAPRPAAWLAFLRQLWPAGPEPEVLQEVFGYLLLPDTRLHSIFMLKGPPRSGKGTILRVLENLIGRANVCAPSIAELGKDFGLEPLIGKQLAAITDMRFGKNANLGEIATNLLRISGEDTVSANRKGKTYWTGRLSVRFLILGNTLPKFNEDSPALAKRFVPLVMNETFEGKEDRQLMDKLLPELPGILNWAVEGWCRLRERGRFELPPASVEAVREIQEQSSAIVAFLIECCDEQPDHSVSKDELYDGWRRWCERDGHRPGTKGDLTRLLSTARPGAIRPGKLGTDERVPSYRGLRLKPVPERAEARSQPKSVEDYWG